MDVNPKNVNEVNKIFLKCPRLEKIYFTKNNDVLPTNGDELLGIVSNFSPMTLREFSFGDSWNFSVQALKLFLENWKSKNRIRLSFIHFYDEGANTWTDEHNKIARKYSDEGVIRWR